MTRDFAALRFAEDKNVSERIYWYVCDFEVKAGDKVLAPIGTHDRLQAAIVERTLSAEEDEAPYDVRLVKRVAGRLGARKLVADGAECLEFGGVRYDEKHYTPFGKVLLIKNRPQRTDELKAYGVTELSGGEDAEIYAKIARAKGCVLLVGAAGENVFKNLLDLVRGINKPLYDLGVKADTVAVLKEKLR